jgi:acetyltransferase-like isoleucine patch superfamily enzyme
MNKFIQKSFFVLNIKMSPTIASFFRCSYLKVVGMQIGNNTIIPRLIISWPHQVSIGSNCQLEPNTIFKYDGIWSPGPSIVIGDEVFIGSGCEFNINSGIKIGKYSNIASGCRFIDHDHGSVRGIRIGVQDSIRSSIAIEDDVWLGADVIVLKGVTIGSGAIVAAGAVVNKSIPANQIWGGVPCKFIKERI